MRRVGEPAGRIRTGKPARKAAVDGATVVLLQEDEEGIVGAMKLDERHEVKAEILDAVVPEVGVSGNESVDGDDESAGDGGFDAALSFAQLSSKFGSLESLAESRNNDIREFRSA